MEKGHTPTSSSNEVSPQRDVEKKDEGMRVVTDAMDVDPFAQAAEGKHGGDYIEYRNMGWIKAGALIMAEVRLLSVYVVLATTQNLSQTIALGILSFPKVFYRLGMFGVRSIKVIVLPDLCLLGPYRVFSRPSL